MTLPIFQGGRLKANYKASKSQFDETLAAYQQSILVALKEVAAYGVSIPTVAQNIKERVEHLVRTQAGIELKTTRIHAVGVQRA